MAVAFTALAEMFKDLGLSAASIQKETLDQAQQTNLFWLNVIAGALLTVIVALASSWIAIFYKEPALREVTLALSFGFLISSLSVQSAAALSRELRFGWQSVASLCGGISTFVLTFTLASMGCKHWSLVWGNLLGGTITTMLLCYLSPFRPGAPKLKASTAELIRFGMDVSVFNIINYFHRNLDDLLIGKFYGSSALGNYSKAYALLMFPINSIRGPIATVAFSGLSRLQGDDRAYVHYYRRVILLIGIFCMPLSAFMFVASNAVVEILLGPQWRETGKIFSILCTVSFCQPAVTMWGTVSLSRGQSRQYLILGLINTGLAVLGICVGLPWGPYGVATGYAIATYAAIFPVLAYCFHATPLQLSDFFSSVRNPALASTLAALMIIVFEGKLSHTTDLIVVMATGILYSVSFITFFVMLPGGYSEISTIWNQVYSSLRTITRY